MWEDFCDWIVEMWELRKATLLAFVVGVCLAIVIVVGIVKSHARNIRPGGDSTASSNGVNPAPGSVPSAATIPAATMAGAKAATTVTNQAPVPSPNAPTEAGEFGQEVTTAAEKADWSSVAALDEQVHDKRSADGFGSLDKQLSIPLKVDCQVHFIRRSGVASNGSEEMSLVKGDDYWLQMKLSSKCYLYVFEKTGSGHLNVIFPNPDYSSLANPADADVRLPESYSTDLAPKDAAPGTYTLYIMGTVWRQTKLERLIKSGANSNQDAILSMMKDANDHSAAVQGLAFTTYQFQYQPVAGSQPK